MQKKKVNHVAFILDGNKRWAKKNNIKLKSAYKKGLENILSLINNSIDYKIKYLTLFTLSSENIYRSSINDIFDVIYDDFSYFFERIIKEKKVNIKIIGSRDKLPNRILNLIKHCQSKTIYNKQLYLNLAFNYGFKDEIKQILKKTQINQSLNLDNDNDIKKLFLLGDIPDPDILIRTGGKNRLSNFIMYNLTYTEIFFIETLWPDFNNNELQSIIHQYNSIERTYGL